MRKIIVILFITFSSFVNAQNYCDTIFNFEPALPDTICFNGPFDLDASNLYNYDDYLWQDGNTDPIYHVTAPGTYICEVMTHTGTLVTNGGFESGDDNFYSDYSDTTLSGDHTLYPEGYYAVGTNPHSYHNAWESMTAHTGGNMMIVNGASDTTDNVWCQTITVGANMDYVFSTWLATTLPEGSIPSALYGNSPARLIFSIDGVPLGSQFSASPVAGDWNIFYEEWHSDVAGTIEICIQNQNGDEEGNDFAIDDIFFGATCVQADTINVVENPTADFPYDNVCTTDSVHFVNTSTANSGVLTDYYWQFGDSYTSTDFEPVHLYDNIGAFTVSLEVTTSFGCTNTTTASVNINPPPTAVITPTYVSCFGGSDGSASVQASGGLAPYTYDWSTGVAGSTISNLSIGSYILTVTDANGCVNTSSVNINQPSPILTSADITDVTCVGSDGEIDLLVSGGTAPYAYNWSNGDQHEDLHQLESSTYLLTITDFNGCTVFDSFDVGYNGVPMSLIADITDVKCNGDKTGSISLNVTGDSPFSFQWSDNISNSNYSGTCYAGDYTVTVTDDSGCKIIKTYQIVEPSPLVSLIGDSIMICQNVDAVIDPSVTGGVAPYTYLWSTSSTESYITVNQDATIPYFVTVTDDNNCILSTNIGVYVFPLPELIVGHDKDTVCQGEPIDIGCVALDGHAPFSYTINNESVPDQSTVYPMGLTHYTIGLIDACGYTDTVDLDLFAYTDAMLSVNADVINGCSPLTVHFNETSGLRGVWGWEFDDNDVANYSTDQHPVHTFVDDGFYTVKQTLQTPEGCYLERVYNNLIQVYPLPEANFDVEKDVVSEITPQIYFYNYSLDNLYNYWSFGDGNISVSISPTHAYSNVGQYLVQLIVENDYGCKDTTERPIVMEDVFKLWVPTAFSPDDDGINDGFRAVGEGIDLDNYWIAVYDRWGELIWESDNLFEYWKGDAKGKGKPVQNGVYSWMVVCKDFNGVEHTKNGPITVIR